MTRSGRFSFILPVCLAIVLGGGWCVCPMAAQGAPKQAAMKCCAIDAASAIHNDSMDCCTTDCGQPADRDKNQNSDQPSWTVVDCLSCVFAGSKATVTLQIDSVRKPDLQPAFAGILTANEMALSDRPFAGPAIASTANRAGSTLLGLRCALNL